MAMSGININEEVGEFYREDFKKKKLHAYFSCKIQKQPGQKDQEVVLSYCDAPAYQDPKNCTEEECRGLFDKMKDKLPDEEPLYVFFDFCFKTQDGRNETKITMISWANDQCCPIKKKMVHASTKDTLKKKLEGIATEIQAADKSDLDFDEVAKSVRKAK